MLHIHLVVFIKEKINVDLSGISVIEMPVRPTLGFGFKWYLAVYMAFIDFQSI